MQQKFSDRLRTARKRAGLKAKDLAKILGISAPYLSQLEKGTREKPSKDLLERAAIALGIPVQQLIINPISPSNSTCGTGETLRKTAISPTSGKVASNRFQRLEKMVVELTAEIARLKKELGE